MSNSIHSSVLFCYILWGSQSIFASTLRWKTRWEVVLTSMKTLYDTGWESQLNAVKPLYAITFIVEMHRPTCEKSGWIRESELATVAMDWISFCKCSAEHRHLEKKVSQFYAVFWCCSRPYDCWNYGNLQSITIMAIPLLCRQRVTLMERTALSECLSYKRVAKKKASKNTLIWLRVLWWNPNMKKVFVRISCISFW